MPVRKRSPTSGNSVYTQPTFTTTLPENPQTSFQTMRQVNPDGSSTVYHVHDSINGGMGGLQPQVVLGGSGGGIPLQQQHHIMSSQQQQAPISGGIVYPYGQQQQPNIVYVQSDEYSDSDVESDDEESSALVQHQHQSQQSPRNKRIKCCLNSKSTSTICILTSIIFAISFIIGYIFLIDAIVTNNRNNHSSYNNNGNQNVMPGSSLRIGSRAYRGGMPSHIQHQKDLEEGSKVYNTPLNSELEEKLGLTEKYYVVKPMISEINVNKLPEGVGGVVGSTDNLGGVGKSQQQQYQRPIQVDKQQHNQLVQEPRNGEVASDGGGNHMKDVIEEKQQETRTVPGIVPRGSQISRDGPVRRRR